MLTDPQLFRYLKSSHQDFSGGVFGLKSSGPPSDISQSSLGLTFPTVHHQTQMSVREHSTEEEEETQMEWKLKKIKKIKIVKEPKVCK